jgi:uncharacterized protein (TIGR03086 family)
MSHDWLALNVRVHDEFARRLGQVEEDQWDAATPDVEWTVRDLVAHVVEEQRWVPQLLGGRTIAQARKELEPLREDLSTEWALYSLAATSAWAAAPREGQVHLSYDTVTIDHYLRELVSDIAIHTWDLARAIGADDELDTDLVEAVWSVFEPQQDTLAASGLFAPPVAIADDAPLQSRLLAVTGRDPGWQALAS